MSPFRPRPPLSLGVIPIRPGGLVCSSGLLYFTLYFYVLYMQEVRGAHAKKPVQRHWHGKALLGPSGSFWVLLGSTIPEEHQKNPEGEEHQPPLSAPPAAEENHQRTLG